VSRYLYLGNHTVGARVLAHVNMLVTGADISPAADLGAGLVVVTPPGTAIFGKAGRDLTVMPCAGLGGEIGRREDVGGGPGLPVLGDEVVLGPHSGVLGPCRVGDRVRIDGFVLVAHRDVPDDTIVDGPPARFRTRAGS
jgi:serine O-acetyltransferase